MLKNPAADTADTGLTPWSGKAPHTPEQLRPGAATAEPVCAPEPWSAARGAAAARRLHTNTGGKHVQQQRPRTATENTQNEEKTLR